MGVRTNPPLTDRALLRPPRLDHHGRLRLPHLLLLRLGEAHVRLALLRCLSLFPSHQHVVFGSGVGDWRAASSTEGPQAVLHGGLGVGEGGLSVPLRLVCCEGLRLGEVLASKRLG